MGGSGEAGGRRPAGAEVARKTTRRWTIGGEGSTGRDGAGAGEFPVVVALVWWGSFWLGSSGAQLPSGSAATYVRYGCAQPDFFFSIF